MNKGKQMKWMAAALILSLVCCPAVTGAEDGETLAASEKAGQVYMPIGEITVHGDARTRDLPGSVDVLGKDQIEASDAVQALDLMRQIPGVTIMNYNFGGVPNGFTLRGWYLPHGRGAMANVDGIPLNCYMENGDGSIDMNQLIVEDLESVEVIKGPMDKRYGNWARAGVINFETRKRGDFAKAKFSYGSYDTQKYYATYGKESEDTRFNQIYSAEYYLTDGYRDNSEYERKNAYGKWFYRPNDDMQVGLVLHGFDSSWDSSGYISEQTWLADPTADNSKNDGGFKDVVDVQMHLDWNLAPNMPLTFKTWMLKDDYSRFYTVPLGAKAQQEYHYEQTNYGMLANLGYDLDLAQRGEMRFDVGTDYKIYNTIDQRYNTYYRTHTSTVHDDEYDMQNYGVYAKANYDPIESLRIFGGVRMDAFDGSLDHNLTGVGRDLQDYDIWTYSSGIIYSFLRSYSLYANYGTSFQLPLGDAGYNQNAPDASDIKYWEVGFKASPFQWLDFRYAYFQSENSDEITQNVNGTYAHEGETLRKGSELEFRLMPVKELEFFASYTFQEATYEAGTNEGKDIRFTPDSIFTAWAEYLAPTQTTVRAAYRKVGDWYLTPNNRYPADGFEVLDLSVRHPLNKNWSLQIGAYNLLDEQYSEFVLNPNGTNYYAGNNDRNFMATVSWEY